MADENELRAAPSAQQPSRQEVLTAGVALAVSGVAFLIPLLIFLPVGAVVLVVIGMTFAALFKEKEEEQLQRWRMIAGRAAIYLSALLAIIALIATIAETHIVSGYLIGVPIFLCLLVFVRVFYIGLGSIVLLPLLGIAWLLSEVSRKALTAWLRLAELLARGLLLVASASGELAGGRISEAARLGAAALPTVISKIMQISTRWASRAKLEVELHEGHGHPHHGGGDTLPTDNPSPPTAINNDDNNHEH